MRRAAPAAMAGECPVGAQGGWRAGGQPAWARLACRARRSAVRVLATVRRRHRVEPARQRRGGLHDAGCRAALAALLAVVVGNDTIAGERDRGSLVPLLVAPYLRDALLFGKLGGIAIAWGVFLLLALPYLWAVGSTVQNLLAAIVSLTLLGTPMVVGFGLLAMDLGARLASSRGSLMAKPSGPAGGRLPARARAEPAPVGGRACVRRHRPVRRRAEHVRCRGDRLAVPADPAVELGPPLGLALWCGLVRPTCCRPALGLSGT